LDIELRMLLFNNNLYGLFSISKIFFFVVILRLGIKIIF